LVELGLGNFDGIRVLLILVELGLAFLIEFRWLLLVELLRYRLARLSPSPTAYSRRTSSREKQQHHACHPSVILS